LLTSSALVFRLRVRRPDRTAVHLPAEGLAVEVLDVVDAHRLARDDWANESPRPEAEMLCAVVIEDRVGMDPSGLLDELRYEQLRGPIGLPADLERLDECEPRRPGRVALHHAHGLCGPGFARSLAPAGESGEDEQDRDASHESSWRHSALALDSR